MPLTRDDLVFFTNGSMTQSSTWGDNDTVATYDRDTTDLGVFDVWKKLAARDPKFGRPEPFISNIDQSGFHTFTITITGDPTLADFMSAKTGVAPPLIKNGCITIVDSNWMITFFVYGKKYYRNQPDDVDIVHGYILFSMDRPGNFIKKPARECTGNEIFAELLYHCGLEDKIDQILAHSNVSIAAMPYITSQFMPRHIADRPKVIPDGCVNLAFIGQFVELPGDCRLHGRDLSAHGDDGGVGPHRARQADDPPLRAALRHPGHRQNARVGGRERYPEPRDTRETQGRRARVLRATARRSPRPPARARSVTQKSSAGARCPAL